MVSESTKKGDAGKVWMWVGLGCGGSLLLLVLIIGGLIHYASRALNLSADPENAAAAALEIMDYKIPGGARGILSLDVRGVQFAGVSSKENPQAVSLILGKYPLRAENGAELQQAFEEQLESQQPQIAEQESRTEARSLCGEPANLTIIEGAQQGSGDAAIVYQTTFAANEFFYFVTLTTSGEEAESLAERVFASLDCR